MSNDVREMITAIGKQVQEAREKKNWTEQRLAEELGVSVQYVKRIAKGGVHFQLNLLVALSDILELDLFHFLDGTLKRSSIGIERTL